MIGGGLKSYNSYKLQLIIFSLSTIGDVGWEEAIIYINIYNKIYLHNILWGCTLQVF